LHSIQTDDSVYTNADEFQYSRFHDRRDPENPTANVKSQMVSTSSDYLLFGHGKHACPGRFFAVNELKIILSQVLLDYDVKFEKEGAFPEPSWFGTALVPDGKAEVMFKART
jgi:cytochrome P450